MSSPIGPINCDEETVDNVVVGATAKAVIDGVTTPKAEPFVAGGKATVERVPTAVATAVAAAATAVAAVASAAGEGENGGGESGSADGGEKAMGDRGKEEEEEGAVVVAVVDGGGGSDRRGGGGGAEAQWFGIVAEECGSLKKEMRGKLNVWV